MFKLALKLLVITLVLTGTSLIISNGRVAADALPNNCGAATDTGLPPRAYDSSGHVIWGNDSDGEGSGRMSSVIMRARDESGNSLNPHFTMHSYLPGGGDQNQIFHWPIGSGGSVNNTDNWPQHGDFQFGTTMHNGDGNPVQCNGWVVMGPGTVNHVGNGWVLNCHSEGPLSQFWISHIDNPGGQLGQWEMLDASGHTVDNNVNSGSGVHFTFNAINGSNMRFTFVWHPQGQTHNPPPKSECTSLDVTDGGDATINGKKFTSDAIRTTVRVYDDSGQVMVHGSGGANYPVILNNTHPPPGAGDWNPATGEGHWTYTPRSPTVHVVVQRQFWHNNSGTWQWDNYQNDSRDHYNCYAASCAVTPIDGNVPGSNGNEVLAGSQFQVVVNVTSTGAVTLSSPTVNGAGLYGGYLNQNDTSYTSPPITVTAPSSVQNFTMTFTVHDNAVGNLGSCTATVPVYQSFTLEPHATLTYKTAESPGPIGYSTYIQNNSSGAISAPTKSTFTSTPFGGGVRCANVGPVNTNGPYNPGGPNYTINPGTCNSPTYNAGDQFCSEIDLTSYNQGYVGPGGALVGTSLNGSATDKQCFTVVNKPYFKAYTGGISAGGDFNNGTGNCSGGGLLAGWNDNTGAQARGASSQLSALALIKITGVASAQAAATTSSPPGTGLTFANTSNGLTNTPHPDSPTLGGNYDTTTGIRCIGDVSPPSSGAGATTYSSSTAISGRTVGDSQSVFVNGDAYISGNITYSGNNKPSFVLRATGNIYIAPGVTELDGVYIAKHKIYTCGVKISPSQFTFMSATNLYGQCNTQLIVYGNFVAQQVNLMRTYGSLRNATAGEQATSGSLSCSYSGGPGNKPSCAGEIFILSPALYLSNPAINLPSNGATQYDAITSLPPVL